MLELRKKADSTTCGRGEKLVFCRIEKEREDATYRGLATFAVQDGKVWRLWECGRIPGCCVRLRLRLDLNLIQSRREVWKRRGHVFPHP